MGEGPRWVGTEASTFRPVPAPLHTPSSQPLLPSSQALSFTRNLCLTDAQPPSLTTLHSLVLQMALRQARRSKKWAVKRVAQNQAGVKVPCLAAQPESQCVSS